MRIYGDRGMHKIQSFLSFDIFNWSYLGEYYCMITPIIPSKIRSTIKFYNLTVIYKYTTFFSFIKCVFFTFQICWHWIWLLSFTHKETSECRKYHTLPKSLGWFVIVLMLLWSRTKTGSWLSKIRSITSWRRPLLMANSKHTPHLRGIRDGIPRAIVTWRGTRETSNENLTNRNRRSSLRNLRFVEYHLHLKRQC